jgi:hypothetical protein
MGTICAMHKVMAAALLSVMATAGCLLPVDGGDNMPPPEMTDGRLLGNWLLTRADGCGVGMVFSSSYTLNIGCVLTDGTVGVQTERGGYGARTGALTFTPSATSCPSANLLQGTYGYSTDSSSLTITGSDAALVFTRATASGSGVARFGCWSGTTFTTHEVVQL